MRRVNSRARSSGFCSKPSRSSKLPVVVHRIDLVDLRLPRAAPFFLDRNRRRLGPGGRFNAPLHESATSDFWRFPNRIDTQTSHSGSFDRLVGARKTPLWLFYSQPFDRRQNASLCMGANCKACAPRGEQKRAPVDPFPSTTDGRPAREYSGTRDCKTYP